MLFDEVASRSFLKRRCDRFEKTIEHLIKEIDALKNEDARLEESII
jgi:exonuclease VII small subunit